MGSPSTAHATSATAQEFDAATRERQLAESLRARRARASVTEGTDGNGPRDSVPRERSPRPGYERSRQDNGYEDRTHDHRERERTRDYERDYERGDPSYGRRDRSYRERDVDRDYERSDRYDGRSRDRGWSRRSVERTTERSERDRDYDRRSRRSSPPVARPPQWRPIERLTTEPDDETVDRTVFCASLSQRVTSHVLGQFFAEHLGFDRVVDAHIVADKVSRRPKGVGYVTLSTRPDAQRARELTGTFLYGIPIHVTSVPAAMAADEQIVQNVAGPGSDNPAARLYVGSLHFDLDAPALQSVFAAFGPVEYVDLHREPSGKSKGFAFVQFTDPAHAQAARQNLQGVEVMGRPLRVNGVNPRPGASGGRPMGTNSYAHPGGMSMQSSDVTAPSFLDEGGGGRLNADARAALMRNLMYRGAAPGPSDATAASPEAARSIPPPLPSTAVKLSNLFNPEEETDPNWAYEMAADVREECSTQYGPVTKIWLDEQSLGDIYVRFADGNSAQRAITALNGRFFNGRSISAHGIPEAIFVAKVG